MWNDPRAMRLAANILFVLAGLIVASAGVYALVRSPAFPLKVISVEGDLSRVREAEVIEALQGRLRGTFFTTDLELVRTLFETVPWVRKAVVRRTWPDRLDVRIEEHVALARWGRSEEQRLVNIHGEIFSVHGDEKFERELPRFSGPDASAAEVVRGYAEFTRILAPLGFAPRQVLLSERRAWQLRLDSGMVLQLGRDLAKDAASERLARFVEAYPRVQGSINRRLDYVDLRYSNGFVLRVPGMQVLDSGKPAPKV